VKVVPLAVIRNCPGAVALTFDDGFRNFNSHALPILREFGFPATVFVVSERCGGRNDWAQPAGIPSLELMSWRELEAAAAAGVELGAHTATHPHMKALDGESLDRELSSAKASIEARIGLPVTTFAYPYGELDERVRAAAGRHFGLCCGTRLDFVSGDSDPLDLPRIDMYYLQDRRWFEALGRPGGAMYIAARRWIRQVRTGGVRQRVMRA
jgi:peptidoglycan/xylan/chitin deacetylase (PgdA/CDA1 family)